MNLSKTVQLSESVRSDTAIRLNLDNTPPPEVLEKMKVTATRIIDPVRNRFPNVRINSFYRSPSLNRKLKGAKNSQHVTGEAVDLDTPDNVDNVAIFEFIKAELVFSQLIGEYPDEKGVFQWVHCSIKEKDNQGQILIKLKSGYVPYGLWQIGQV
jgi:hypothetical protein